MGGCYSVAPEHGPRIAAVGGGTGLSTLLRGLKLYTKNLTAIVTVADDGGGSGRLRQDLGMPPPGDIRSCLEALANAEPLMAQLMHLHYNTVAYRLHQLWGILPGGQPEGDARLALQTALYLYRQRPDICKRS